MTIIYQVWHKIPKFGILDFADKRQRGHFGEPDRRIGRSGDSPARSGVAAPLLRFAISQNRSVPDGAPRCAQSRRSWRRSRGSSSGAAFCTMWPTPGNTIRFALAERLLCYLTVTDIFTDGCMLHRTL